MKQLLRNLITVKTSKGSDNFYFKNPALVGTVNGKDAYCVFYYSHYDEYMVYALAWEGDGFDFHYLNEKEMTSTHDFHFRTLDKSGKFVPAIDVIDIKPDYLELIYKATQEQENIEYTKMFSELYDTNRELQYKLQRLRDGKNGYSQYDDETYLDEFPKRLILKEYHLLSERYVNLKPNLKEEEELVAKKAYTREQILSQRDKDKKTDDAVMRILKQLSDEEKSK